MPETHNSEERLTAIESLLMQIQYDVEQLHEAVLGQRRDLESLRRVVDQLHGQVERLEIGPESRDPHAEKPPHY